MKRLLVVLAALVLLVPPSVGQAAVVTSNVASVSLSLTASESLTVSATPTSIAFTLDGAGTQAAASGPISVTTAWQFTSTRNVWTVAYFGAPPAALTGRIGTTLVNIPSSEISASITGTSGRAGAFAPCTLTEVNAPASGAGGSCPDVATITGAAAQGSETDSILLEVNLPSVLSPGNYTGVINIVSQSN